MVGGSLRRSSKLDPSLSIFEFFSLANYYGTYIIFVRMVCVVMTSEVRKFCILFNFYEEHCEDVEVISAPICKSNERPTLEYKLMLR